MRRWWLAAILVLAAGLRLGWILLVPNAQYSDSVWYDAAAANLAANGIYGPDQPSAWFPPGYSFWLAAIYRFAGHVQLAGKLGNVAIGVALTGGTYLLGRLVLGETIGLLGALFIAIWPNLVFHTAILSSDLLAACGFVVAMWLGMRETRGRAAGRARAIVLGLLIGWMVLVRPVGVILLAALGLGWWLRSGSLVRASLRLAPIVLVVGIVVGGWTVRNYLQFGEIITIATNGGYNFWQTNHRYADGNDTFWPTVPMDDPEYITMSTADEFTKNRAGYRYALAYLSAHPTHLLTMLPTKLFWLYHSDTSGLYESVLFAPMEGPSPVADFFDTHQRLVEAATFRFYEAVMALGVLGALLGVLRGRSDWVWPLLALPLLLTFFHLFFHAKDRFHIPLDGVVAVFAAFALTEALRLARGWLKLSRPVAGARPGWSA